jgi:hypothetical protein
VGNNGETLKGPHPDQVGAVIDAIVGMHAGKEATTDLGDLITAQIVTALRRMGVAQSVLDRMKLRDLVREGTGC